jgi:ATP-dependent DNA helicase RecG
LPTLNESIRLLHRPPLDLKNEVANYAHPARRRLALEELLAYQLSRRQLRQDMQRQLTHVLSGPTILKQRFLSTLGFVLTQAQQRVIDEIQSDLRKPHPMLRLLQGDVGSGKTIVAAVAALQAVEAGFQVAFMTPTELLSEQHYRNLQTWMAPLSIEVGWLTAGRKGKFRKTLLTAIEEGELRVIVGTHALFQDKVRFHNLALIIIDEQHRFGVHQRFSLLAKGQNRGFVPHQLIMTATPIPRTLTMSVYTALDTSTLDELPPGRHPVKTAVVSESRRNEVIERVRSACHNKRQVYWVCTLIEESEALQCQAAEKVAELLTRQLTELSIGLMHGRMTALEKEKIMLAFKAGDIDLLVATTVIEVGVDVPNASLMIIENAERLGLAQLHQLRGRVGRGNTQSSCILLYRPPLSEQAYRRLAVIRETNDGFAIARHDLELRGPGELTGTRQTGVLQFRIADLSHDQDLLPAARNIADKLLYEYPNNALAIMRRWLHESRKYAGV